MDTYIILLCPLHFPFHVLPHTNQPQKFSPSLFPAQNNMIFALKDGKGEKKRGGGDMNGFNRWCVESGLSVEVTQVKITFLHCHSHYHLSFTLYAQTS